MPDDKIDFSDSQDFADVLSQLKKKMSDLRGDLPGLTGDIAKAVAQLAKVNELKEAFQSSKTAINQLKAELETRKNILDTVLKQSSINDRLSKARLQQALVTAQINKLEAEATITTGEELTKLRGSITALNLQSDAYQQIIDKKGKIAKEETDYIKNVERDLSLMNALNKGLKKSIVDTDVKGKKTKGILDALGKMHGPVGELYESFKKLESPFGVFLGLVTLAIARFFSLDEAAQKFRETTGTLMDQSIPWQKQIEATQLAYAKIGATIESVGEDASTLVNIFGSSNVELLKSVNLMTILGSKGLNVAREDSAEVLRNFTALTGQTGSINENLIGWTLNLSKAAGPDVQFNKVMHDIASASGKTLTMLRGNPKELVKAAVAARRLGSSIEDISSSAENYLDFDKNINDEMNLSVLLGRQINGNKMRQDSYDGNLAALAQDQVTFLKSIGGLTGKNAFQTKAIADYMGMSVESLTAMNAKQVLLSKASQKSVDAYNAATKAIDTTNLSADDQLNILTEQAKQQKVQAQLANVYNEAMSNLGNALLPSIKTLMPDIVKGAQLLGETLVWVAAKIHTVSDFFAGMGAGGSAVFLSVTAAITLMLGSLKTTLSVVRSLIGYASDLSKWFIELFDSKPAVGLERSVVRILAGMTEGEGVVEGTVVAAGSLATTFGTVVAAIPPVTAAIFLTGAAVAEVVSIAEQLYGTFKNIGSYWEGLDFSSPGKAFASTAKALGQSVAEFTGGLIKGVIGPFEWVADWIGKKFLGQDGKTGERVNQSIDNLFSHANSQWKGGGKENPNLTPEISTPIETQKRAIRNRKGDIVRYDDVPVIHNLRSKVSPKVPTPEAVAPVAPAIPQQSTETVAPVTTPSDTNSSIYDHSVNTSNNTDSMVTYLKDIDKTQSDLLAQMELLVNLMKEGKINTGAISINLDGKKVGDGLAANASMRNKTPFG